MSQPSDVDEDVVPAPDVATLTAFLDGRWRTVREEVRAQLQDARMTPTAGLSVDEHRARTWEQLQVIAATPQPRMLFPVAYGGGGEIGGAVSAFEMLGFADLSLLVKSGVQFGLFGGAILHLGTERHHERYLADVMSLALPGCFAMTETGHGSDVQSLRTTATYDADRGDFVIRTPDADARKDYIGNAARDGRMAVVFAQLMTRGEGHGVHAFLVPIRETDGSPCRAVRIEDCGHKAGLNGVDNGRLSFDGVRVPRDALLDRYASVAADGSYSSPVENETRRFFTMLGTLVQGRISVSGAAVSATKCALAIAVRYGTERRQFHPPETAAEVPVLDFLAHQRRLLPAVATTYALHFAQEVLVSSLHDVFSREHGDDDDVERRQLESLAAGVKATTTWHATRTIQACREACGGAGYLSENRLPQLKADTDVFTTFEGDNTVLLQLVAKGLLTEYSEEFGSLDMLGTVRFVASSVVETVLERTAARGIAQRVRDVVPGGDEDGGDLYDRDFQRSLFAWRAKHVLDGVARRLRKAMQDDADAFQVFNDAQDHVLLAAQAHVDQVVVDCFADAVERCTDDSSRALLGKLCDLHVLSTIERERGWFLEHGRLTPARSKAVTSAVNALCRELRPHARLLVDAWGIPDEVLAAPIALGDEALREAARD